MINWDEMPEWADRVVVGPCSGSKYWANADKRISFEGGKQFISEWHGKENWQTIWPPSHDTEEHTGLSVDYYKVPINNPTSGGDPYTAECNDIIETLNMTYAEGNVVKAIWRRAAERTLGKRKKGNNSRYDAEKAVFFSGRILEQENTD